MFDKMSMACYPVVRDRGTSVFPGCVPGAAGAGTAILADLNGPTCGVVELPLRLFWSAPDREFSLDDPAERGEVYRIVVREARCPDLAVFLDGDMLIALWPDIVLPEPVRRAWEDEHPALRPAPPLSVLSAGWPSRLAGKPGPASRPARASASRPPSPPRVLSGLAGNPDVRDPAERP